MKNILILWQRLHYNVFEFNKFTQIHIFGFTVLLLLKNKYIKKAYLKRGVQNPERIVRNTLISPKQGNIIWLSDGCMCLLIILLMFSILNIISAFLGVILLAQLNKIMFVLICLILSLVINYYALWKDDKYLIFFKEFDKEPREKKIKWGWLSFAIIIASFSILILSFYSTSGIISISKLKKNLREKEISEILNKAEDSLYRGFSKDYIDKEKESYLEKLEDSLYKRKKSE